MSPQPNKIEIAKKYKSFSMISSVHKDSVGSSKEDSCGDRNVAPWGSIHPVYSSQSGQIYKNMECAVEDGITDGTLWIAMMSCPSDEVDGALIGFETKTIPDNCVIYFVYPGDQNDLQNLNCSTPLIDTCPEPPEFQMPQGTSLSKNEIVKLCTSGFVSPYQAEKLYANVFCHICNNESFSIDLKCEENSKSNGNNGGIGFTALFDASFMAKISRNNVVKQDTIPRACYLKNVRLKLQ